MISCFRRESFEHAYDYGFEANGTLLCITSDSVLDILCITSDSVLDIPALSSLKISLTSTGNVHSASEGLPVEIVVAA